MKKLIALAMVVVMAFAVALPALANPITDVPETHWAADAVQRLTTLGIITGYTDNTFRGQQNITRYEVAVMIDRFLDYLEGLLDQNQEAVFDIIDSRIMNIITPETGENASWLERIIVQNINDMNEDQWNAIQDELAALSAKVDELEGREIPYDSLVEIVEDLVNSPAGSDASLKGEIARLERMINDLKNTQGTLSEIQKEIDGIRSDLNKIANSPSNNDLLTLSGRISYLESKVASLGDGGVSNNALVKDVADLSGLVKDLQNAVAALQKADVSAQNDIITLSGRISYLEQQTANQPALSSEVKDLSNKIKALENQIADLPHGGVTSLMNDYMTLSGRVSYLEGKYASQAASDSTVAAEIASLKNQLSNMGVSGVAGSASPQMINDVTVLNDKIIALEKKVDDKLIVSGKDESSLVAEVAELQAEMAEVNAAVFANPGEDLSASVYNMLLTTSGRLSYLEGKVASLTESERAMSGNVKTLNDQILTLSGRIAYLEAKFANFNPSEVKEYTEELATIKNDLEKVETATSFTPALVNDITVLNNKILELDKKIDGKMVGTSYDGEPLESMINALDDRVTNLTATVGNLGLNDSFAKEINEIKAEIASLGGNELALANDITVLSDKITALNNKVTEAGYADSNLKNDVLAVNKELDAMNSYLGSLVVEGGEVKLDDQAYNYFLTLSGRLSYLEGKVANLTAVDPKITDEVAALAADVEKMAGKMTTSSGLTVYNDVTVLADRIGALEDKVYQLSVADKEMADLKTQIKALEIQLQMADSSLGEQIDAMNNAMASEATKVNAQRMTNLEVGNDITVLSDKIQNLENAVNSMGATNIAAVEHKVNELDRIVSDNSLKVEVASLKNNVAALQNSILALQKEMSSIETGTITGEGISAEELNLIYTRISQIDTQRITDYAALEAEIAELKEMLENSTVTSNTQTSSVDNVGNPVINVTVGGDGTESRLLYDRIVLIESNISNIEKLIAELREDMINNDQILENEINDLAMALADFMFDTNEKLNMKSDVAEVNALAELVNSNSADVNELKALLEKLNASRMDDAYIINDITVLSERIAGLEDKLHYVNSATLATLRDDVASLEENNQIQFTNIQVAADKVDERLSELESELMDHVYFANDIAVLSDKIYDLEEQIAGLRILENTVSAMGNTIQELATEFSEELAALDQRVTALEVGFNGMSQTLGQVSDKANSNEARIGALETDVASLRRLVNSVKISGSNTLQFLYRDINGTEDNAVNEFFDSPFDYSSTGTTKEASAISNTTAFTLSLRPDEGVSIDLGFEFKLKNLFSNFDGLSNAPEFTDTTFNLSIIGDKVVAKLYAGDIRTKLPTTFTNYTLHTGIFSASAASDYGLRKYKRVNGITGDVKFFNDTLTISTLFAKLLDDKDTAGLPISPDVEAKYKYLYGAAAVFEPTKNVKVGVRVVGDFYDKVIADDQKTEVQSTVYGADFSVKFLEKLKASGEFAYFTGKKEYDGATNLPIDPVEKTSGSAMKFNVTAGLEPGLMVIGDFERIDPDYAPNFMIKTGASNHNSKGRINPNRMTVGVTVQLPKVIGFTLSGKLEYHGDYDWSDKKYRTETLKLTYEPRLSTGNFLKLTAQVARENDLLITTNAPKLKMLGKIEYERNFMTFDASYNRVNLLDGSFSYDSSSVNANLKLNIVKDMVTLKGGVKLTLNETDPSVVIAIQQYTAEALVALKFTDVVTVDLTLSAYYRIHGNVQEMDKDDYLQLKGATTVGWNITKSTKLTTGLTAEYKLYHVDLSTGNRYYAGKDNFSERDGLYTTVNVGVEQKVFTSTTISLGYTFKHYNVTSGENALTPTNTYKATMNQFEFKVKTVF